jgi:NADPH-dependent glutamate synthase beta subunit-like oxidoreductase
MKNSYFAKRRQSADTVAQTQGYLSFNIQSRYGNGQNDAYIKGCNLQGVIPAGDITGGFSLIELYQAGFGVNIFTGKKIAVTGCSKSSLDAALIAESLGGKVTVVCRCDKNGLTEDPYLMSRAADAGIEFIFLANPVEIKNDGNGYACGLFCEEMALYEKDNCGRSAPVPLYDSEFLIDADIVILSDR